MHSPLSAWAQLVEPPQTSPTDLDGLVGAQYGQLDTQTIEDRDALTEPPKSVPKSAEATETSSAPKVLLNPTTWWNALTWSKPSYEFLDQREGWEGMLSRAQEGWQQFYQPQAIAGKIVPAAEPVINGVTDIVKDADVTVPSNILYVRFSKPFLEEYFCKQIDDVRPVRDTMLGSTVRGNARTVGRTELELVEDPLHANARLTFVGTNSFNTISSQDVIQVFCRGTTKFASHKTLSFDGMKVRQSAPTTEASTESTITNITTSLPGLRGKISLRIANDRAAESQETAKRITTERTKKKVEAAFSKIMEERAAAFTEELKEQYAKLPFEGRFSIKEIQCSTTPNQLQIVVVGRGDKDPSFVPPPSLLSDAPDIEVHIHTSVIEKAIRDTAFRDTLQSAVTSIVDRPLKFVATSVRKSKDKEPERKMKVHWDEGKGMEWLSLGWHANEKVAAQEKTLASEKR